ncbi:MAG: DUF4097 family beta strand repeat-containing protein [Clostridiaceae bacterium]|nr:DUF4097 family beta strand repeat-containing protein [Eubacteriales bacterium]
MNRKEFLTRLEAALATLSYEERQAALRYYEEYLWDAGEENEAAAIAELGAPEALAERIIRESRAYAKESANAEAQPGMNGSRPVSPFTSINVDLANAAVTLYKGEAYSVALDFPEAYPLPDVEVRDGTLHIKEKKFSHFSFFGFRSFGFIKKAEVIITLPDAQYERFAFDMVNGALKIPQLRVRELKSDCVNGAVSITGVTAERIHLDNVNGKISASDVFAAESCKCDTVNGGIELSGVLRGRIHADAVNGGISISIPLSGKDYNLSLSTVSGSVRVNGQKMGKSFNVQNGAANSVHAETVNGGIQVGFQSGTIVL